MKDQMTLSSFEILLLRWASQGRSFSEVAAIEGTNPAHVQLLLNQSASTLGVISIAEAIKKAKFLNII